MNTPRPRVVVIGGGFGGLTVVKALRSAPVDVVLLDRSNHHLFQPLLYQVAMAALSPGDIATPLRAILSKQKNVTVFQDEVTSIDTTARTVNGQSGQVFSYDWLVVATGSRHSYFSHPEWETHAPGLKTVADALAIRERMLRAFEQAELRYKSEDISKYLTFVVIGGGPTGVEVAGAIAEIAQKTMRDFRRIDTRKTRILLVEGSPEILAAYPRPLAEKAHETLRSMGVEVQTGTQVVDIGPETVKIGDALVSAQNMIWAAGNVASPLVQQLPGQRDRAGRLLVGPDCAVPGHENVFVIGDAAHFLQAEKPLPGVAQVAMQQGSYIARLIKKRLSGPARPPFRYRDYGSMATIGRARAVAMIGGVTFTGLPAWMLWSFIHVFKMISFRNRYKVMAEWAWYYLSYRNGVRLITGRDGTA